MKTSEHLWQWLTINWGPLGIATFLGYCLGAGFNLFKWRYGSWKELKQEREENEQKQPDARVLEALGDRTLKTSSKGMTGAGMRLVKAGELAAHLNVDREKVDDSLERLEMCGRVRNGGAAIDDPHPVWFLLPH